MSTKIYDAYKFNGTASDLIEHLKAYRDKWREFQILRLAAIVQIPDQDALFLKIREQSTTAVSSWDAIFDVRGSVAVYFHKRKVYLQTFIQTEGTPPTLTDDRFEDFHYQNQTDPWYAYEADLSPQQKAAAARNYKLRKRVWDAIFSGECSSPVEAGMTYDFCSHYDYHTIARSVCAKVKAK